MRREAGSWLLDKLQFARDCRALQGRALGGGDRWQNYLWPILLQMPVPPGAAAAEARDIKRAAQEQGVVS